MYDMVYYISMSRIRRFWKHLIFLQVKFFSYVIYIIFTIENFSQKLKLNDLLKKTKLCLIA